LLLALGCSGKSINEVGHVDTGGASSSAGMAGSGGQAEAGTGGSAAGSSGAMASGGSAGKLTSSEGGAGDEQIEGQPGAHHPDCGRDCGGSPVGRWIYTRETSCNLLPLSGSKPPEDGECSILLLPNSTPDEPPVRLERAPRFDFSGQPVAWASLVLREDGFYAVGVSYNGTGHMALAGQCRKLGENVVACADVAAAVEPSLLGEGAGRNFQCTDNAEGGCDCSYEITFVTGSTGIWRTTADGKLLLQPSYSAVDAPAPEPVTYCSGETLALGPEFQVPGQPVNGEATVFARADCTDAVRGPGENDVDCGGVCPDCP
jgi:hypothetical protein